MGLLKVEFDILSPGRKLSEILWGRIWTTSCWVKPDPLELRGMFCCTVMLLVGYSTNRLWQPLLCRFWTKSQRDVRVRPLPKSCVTNAENSTVISCITDANMIAKDNSDKLYSTSCAHQAQLGWIRKHSSHEVALPLIHTLRPKGEVVSTGES